MAEPRSELFRGASCLSMEITIQPVTNLVRILPGSFVRMTKNLKCTVSEPAMVNVEFCKEVMLDVRSV